MISKKFAILLLAFLSAAFIFGSAKTLAFDLFPNCSDAKGATSSVCQDKSKSSSPTNNVVLSDIRKAANLIAFLGGALAVIMVIISAFKIVTTGGLPGGQRSGDTSGVKSARAQLVNALIGLVIIAMAWTITRFITDVILQ